MCKIYKEIWVDTEYIGGLISMLSVVGRQTDVRFNLKNELSRSCKMGLSMTEISLPGCSSRRTVKH